MVTASVRYGVLGHEKFLLPMKLPRLYTERRAAGQLNEVITENNRQSIDHGDGYFFLFWMTSVTARSRTPIAARLNCVTMLNDS
ncbi:hypothetical protein QYG89_16125 [Bacillus sp. B190/17]|uniref:Uncharacterized protein n=1 Tax=Bacillus lumedeiriae TaxID=3058829 RepID=A0ABW8ID91_9BACI